MEKTDKTEKTSTVKNIIAKVKSPSREGHIREGNGFSLAEIESAGKTIAFLKELNIKIDYFRKSAHDWNIEQLKALKTPKKKEKKKKPYSTKEERLKERHKRIAKKKVIPKEEIESVPEIEEELFYEADEGQTIPKKKLIKPIPKVKTPAETTRAPVATPKVKTPTEATPTLVATPKVKTPPKTKLAPVTEAKPKPAPEPEEIEIPLTKLSGLGSATAKKFQDLGVTSVKGLIEEDPEELAMLISGVSADRIKKWVQEGKELLEK
jgi:ribosomal protein L13E/predicted flap endonuclease-1-like 5' DNA nuclease